MRDNVLHGINKNITRENSGGDHGITREEGAKQILTDYNAGEIATLSFLIEHNGKQIPFRLPIRWEKCLEAMKRDKSTPKSYCKPDQAKRTAWRIVLRWVQAQFALIDTDMATIIEVMLPYAQVGEQTFYEKIETEHFKMLPEIT